MWKFLSRSFWSGQFWPPATSVQPPGPVFPLGVWPTRLRAAQPEYQLESRAPTSRLSARQIEFRLRFEG